MNQTLLHGELGRERGRDLLAAAERQRARTGLARPRPVPASPFRGVRARGRAAWAGAVRALRSARAAAGS